MIDQNKHEDKLQEGTHKTSQGPRVPGSIATKGNFCTEIIFLFFFLFFHGNTANFVRITGKLDSLFQFHTVFVKNSQNLNVILDPPLNSIEEI